MAKDKAETLAIVQKFSDYYEMMGDFLRDDVYPALDALETEAKVGGPADYIDMIVAEIDRHRQVMNGLWVAVRRLCFTVNMPLGAYAGSAAPTQSPTVNLSLFNDKLVADTEEVASIGITSGAFSPAGGNVGTGSIIEVLEAPDGQTLEAGHNETITVRCCSILPGNEAAFCITGGERKTMHADEDMGTGNAGFGYTYDWGYGVNDFSSLTTHMVTSERPEFTSYNGGDRRNMIGSNGNFEEPIGTGAEKIKGAIITSGESNVAIEASTPIAGDQSLRLNDACSMYFELVGTTIHRPEFTTLLMRRRGTIAGDLTIQFESGPLGSPTAHKTLVVAVGSESADAVVRKSISYNVPAALGELPRIRLTLGATTGSGSIEIDEKVSGACILFDNNRAVAVVDGVTKFRKGDSFSATNALANTGKIQQMLVELFGRGVRHAGTADYWED